MKTQWLRWFTGLAAIAVVSLSAAEYPVALVSDPPPAVDGSAERLTRLPTFKMLDNPDQILFGRKNYTGRDDLSAEVVVGYDKLNLYVGAKVCDQLHRQSHFGRDLWKGDHLMLVVDYPRQSAGVTDLSKVYRIGLSPGDFAAIKPEAFVWSPAGVDASAIRVAAQKNTNGYTLEAAIPWSVFKISPVAGMEFGMDLLVSDSDGEEQDTLLSLSGDQQSKKPHDPIRLLTAVLADANGRIDPLLRQKNEVFDIAAERQVPHGGAVSIQIPDDVAARLRELIVNARIESKRTGGATYVMQLKLNGKLLTMNEIRNRDQKLYFRHYIVVPVNPGQLWYLPYAPNFDMKKNEPFRSGGVTVNPYELRFDVSKLLRPSGNVLEVVHAHGLPSLAPLTVRISGTGVLSPKLEESVKLKPAPTGELPVIAPTPPLRQALFQAELTPGGALAVTRHGRREVVQSAFSTRTPGWAALTEQPTAAEWRTWQADGDVFRGQTAEFALERRIQSDAERIRVIDKVTNLSSDLLPLMYRHDWQPAADGEFRAAGYQVTSENYVTQSGEHPVVAVLSGDRSAGLVAEDDLSRAQGQLFRRNGQAGLENLRLALAPGKTVELEYTFYPLEKGDYFLLLNRIRRHWRVNFTIPAGGAFVPARQVGGFSDAELKNFMVNKGVGFAMDNVPVINGIVTHGTRLREVDMNPSRELRKRIAKLAPDVKSLIYYHSFIANGKHDVEEFKADAIQTAGGVNGDYGGGRAPLFLPAAGSAFAQRQEELLDERYALGIEGIFWDEIAYSMYKYDYNPAHWDGVSVLIHPQTHQVIRKVTNVTLATLEWRQKMAEKIMKRGALIGNGAPQTRTFTQLHFPRFVETGSITNLVLSQLYTPIALGDHLSERNEFDAYRNMVKGLDFGAVYYYYRAEVKPTHPTLASYMYPITPVELGPGYIIGQERILTNRSGLFTWNDASGWETHVFNREGLEEKYPVKILEKNGVTYAEVRIPEGYGVALVRR